MESKWSQINREHRKAAIVLVFMFYITLFFACVWLGYILPAKLFFETAFILLITLGLTNLAALFIQNLIFSFRSQVQMCCILMIYCFFFALAVCLGYEVRQLDRDIWAVFRDIGSVSMAVVAILGIVAVCIENYFRFRQARQFGVPFRVTYHSLHDAADIIAKTLTLIGLGIVFPTSIAILNLYSLLVVFLIALSTGGALALAVYAIIKPEETDKRRLEYMHQGQKRVFTPTFATHIGRLICGSADYKFESLAQVGCRSVLFILFVVVVWSFATFAYVNIALIPIDDILAGTGVSMYITIIIILYICVIGFIYALDLNARITHQNRILSKHMTPITTIIDGVLHLVTVRYSSEKWIMIPCTTEYGYLFYKKGEFIVKELDRLTMKQDRYKDVLPSLPPSSRIITEFACSDKTNVGKVYVWDEKCRLWIPIENLRR